MGRKSLFMAIPCIEFLGGKANSDTILLDWPMPIMDEEAFLEEPTRYQKLEID